MLHFIITLGHICSVPVLFFTFILDIDFLVQLGILNGIRYSSVIICS